VLLLAIASVEGRRPDPVSVGAAAYSEAAADPARRVLAHRLGDRHGVSFGFVLALLRDNDIDFRQIQILEESLGNEFRKWIAVVRLVFEIVVGVSNPVGVETAEDGRERGRHECTGRIPKDRMGLGFGDTECRSDVASEVMVGRLSVEDCTNLIGNPVLSLLSLLLTIITPFVVGRFAKVFPHRPAGKANVSSLLGEPVHRCKYGLHAQNVTVGHRQIPLFDNKTEELVVALIRHPVTPIV